MQHFKTLEVYIMRTSFIARGALAVGLVAFLAIGASRALADQKGDEHSSMKMSGEKLSDGAGKTARYL